jgi:hypothetical protein
MPNQLSFRVGIAVLTINPDLSGGLHRVAKAVLTHNFSRLAMEKFPQLPDIGSKTCIFFENQIFAVDYLLET